MRQLPANKILRYLKRELSRDIPHGLMSWRYILPSQEKRIADHRTLWWRSPTHLPRIVWLLLELWLWLRWITCTAWKQTRQTVKAHGADVMREEGISLFQQTYRTLSLSIAWCMPPYQIYQYNLYRTPELALDFVFDHETSAYHHWRSQPDGPTRASLTLLQDKIAATAWFESIGIPGVPTLICVSRHSHAVLDHLLPSNSPSLFCKSRFGSSGLGAFAAWKSSEGWIGCKLNGARLSTTNDVQQALKELLQSDDVIVQPRLQNHLALQTLAHGDDAITVRVITRRLGHDISCWNAQLEIPLSFETPAFAGSYHIMDIEIDSGRCILHTDESVAAPFFLPHWNEILHHSCCAHKAIPDLWAVAWDWIVTNEGPRLLEGNAGWRLTHLQQQGGLLKIVSPTVATIQTAQNPNHQTPAA